MNDEWGGKDVLQAEVALSVICW